MRVIRPVQFDKPKRDIRRDARREAARKRRAKQRDNLQRRLYRMIEPSFDIMWEAHDNDNRAKR